MAILDHDTSATTSTADRSIRRIDGSNDPTDPGSPVSQYAGDGKGSWTRNPDLDEGLTAQTVIQSKGSFATVAEANAQAPGTGPSDFSVVGGLLHYWDDTNSTYKLDDVKAPLQTIASFATYELTEAMWNANRMVPVEQADGSIRLYLPTKTSATYVAWQALAHADQYAKAGGADATPIVTLSVFPDAATASNDEIIGAKAAATKDEAQDQALADHVADRLRPHLPDGGTVGQVPVIQADNTIAYEDAASFGQHIGDWDVTANAGFPTPVAATGDWWAVTGVTEAETNAGGKVWNALTVNNGDLLASKDDTGTAFTHVKHPVVSTVDDSIFQDPTDETTFATRGGKQLHNWYSNVTQFDSIPADGQLIAFSQYDAAVGDPTASFPTARVDGTPLQVGDWLRVRNPTPVKNPFILFVLGPVRLQSTGAIVSGGAVNPNFDITATWDGAAWDVPISIELVITLNSLDSGTTLLQNTHYIVEASVPDMEFFLPDTAALKLSIRLATNSLHGFTVNQSAAVATQQIRDENGNINGSFSVPLSAVGQLTNIEGNPNFPPVGRWNIFREWVIRSMGAVKWHTSAITLPIVGAKNIYPTGTDLSAVLVPDHVRGANYTIETGDVGNELLDGNVRGYLSNGVIGAGGKWIREITADPHLLKYISVAVRSAGTNAGSSVQISFDDVDGNTYPASDWLISGTIDQYSGGTAQIVLDNALWNGTLGLGRNKQGTVFFKYIGENPNGLSAVTIVGASGASSDGAILAAYEGTNQNDSWSNKGSVNTVYWSTIQAPEATDQAAPWIDGKEYPAGEVFSHSEEDATTPDPNQGEQFNWRVTDAIAEDEFLAWDGTNYAAIQGKLERFAIAKIPEPLPTVVYPLAADNMQLGPLNIRYQDDPDLTALQQPTGVLGKDYAVGVVAANRGDITGEPKVKITHYTSVDRGNGVELLETDSPKSDLPIRRYTADGAISDEDQRAIFETGANNMTLPVSVQDRLIQIISEGPATIITADGTEQFTGSAGTSTDSILNVNETFKWATILGRGAAAGWSQYVGLVATAQSVGAMVDFSESPGPGDAGSFSLALTNSGANLRYILTLTCSNGTNFSPPLDVDDGTNRWWYDFDHTTGVVNIRRFGAFAGGSVRGVALYS